jgi:hypothetical protein
MAEPSDLLVLHGVRLLGMATAARVADRFALDPGATDELLLDQQALGLVTWSEFAGRGGWSLTGSGRVRGEELLAEELDAAGAREAVRAVHAEFLPLNARFLQAVTDWQIRPDRVDPLAPNDHTDWRWDERVLDELGALGRRLAPLVAGAVGALPRFEGYAARYDAALARVERGERSFVDGIGVDSCHTVWFELHEDLIATLGLGRG